MNVQLSGGTVSGVLERPDGGLSESAAQTNTSVAADSPQKSPLRGALAAPSSMEVVLVMMATKPRLSAALARWRESCAQPGIRCAAYLDQNVTAADRLLVASARPIRLFGAAEYLSRYLQWMPAAAISRLCCQSHRFFCEEHRRDTFAAQYRFLPAMQHAQRVNTWEGAHASSWMVVVDDDSIVNSPALLRVLRSIDASLPLQLGVSRARSQPCVTRPCLVMWTVLC